MSDQPKFSVIIPTFNRCTLLPNAIESVLNQSFGKFELLIIDDGSTDLTRETVAEYTDERVIYIYQERRELSGARNTGTRHASGKFICFLDDDDTFMPNHLKVLNESIYQHTGIFIFRTSLLIPDPEETKHGKLLPPDSDPLKFVWDQFVGITTFCFPSEVFNLYSFPEEFILFEDKHFLARVLLEYKLIQIPEHSVVYNISEQSRSFTAYLDEDRLINQEACVDNLYQTHGEALKKRLGRNFHRKKKSILRIQAAHQANRNNDALKSLYHLKKAIQHFPSLRYGLKYGNVIFRIFA